MVWNTMFPRDPQPEGLVALMERFRGVEVVRRYIRLQLVAGAKVALAFVRIQHPGIDLEAISGDLPLPPGGGFVDMIPHYTASHTPALRIFRRMLDEDADYFINFVVCVVDLIPCKITHPM
jgi:hypothetical protein